MYNHVHQFKKYGEQMNYSQEIERIYKIWNYSDSNGWEIASKFLTIAEKMQEELSAKDSAILKLREHLNKDWTPCSDRLPEKEGSYLCTNEHEDRERSVEYVSYGNRLEILNIKHDGDEAYSWITNWKVIAWMPLPEPWSGEV